MKKKIVLLGSTGSIGKSFLNILKKDKKNCDILLLSVNRNINELLKQLKIFKVKVRLRSFSINQSIITALDI